MSDPPDKQVKESSACYTPHFGRRLQRLRMARGWSLEEFSQRSGIAAITLEELETTMEIPAARMLERLCVALAIPVAQLLRD